MKLAFALVISCAILPSCASIVSKSDWPVSITSSEPGVPFTVKNAHGVALVQGKTPTIVTLSAKEGFFDGADYTIETGHATLPLSSSMNGWYIGNIVFGGLIGFLIVDPATGAMWKLPEHIMLPSPPASVTVPTG